MRRQAGNDYFYDPDTDMIHYLNITGIENYAIDPRRNVTVYYNTLEELRLQLARADAGLDAEEETDGAAEQRSTACVGQRV